MQVDPSVGYSVQVIDGQTHVYCRQSNGSIVDNVLTPGRNRLTFSDLSKGVNRSNSITLNWPGINSNTSFLAVGNPNTVFSVNNLSKIEVKDSNIVYGYIASGGQTGTTGFEKVIKMFEKIAEANGMSEPTIGLSGYSGSGPAAYVSTRDSNSAKFCILADPCSRLHNYNSGDGVYTLVLTSRNGNDEQRILKANTKNTFIIELNQSIYKVHGIIYDLVSKYNLTSALSGNLDINTVTQLIKADGYDCKLIYIDGEGNRHNNLDNETAQKYLQQMMTEANVSSIGKLFSSAENLSDLNSMALGIPGNTLGSNLTYVSAAMDAIKSQITEHIDLNYESPSGEAKIIDTMYKASNYYGSVTNLLYGNLSAETEAVYGIANAIFKMDNCASMVAETTLSDGVKGLFSMDNPTVKIAVQELASKSAELFDTAKTAVMAGGRYDELTGILGNKAEAGGVGKISISSLESAIKSIVPNLESEINKATGIKASVDSFMTGIGVNNILQGDTWDAVKTNMSNYSSLLDCNVKAATFISDTIKTAMGMVANYIQNAASSIEAMGTTKYGSLASIDELDDSKLGELTQAIVSVQLNIDSLTLQLEAMEASKHMVVDGYTDPETGTFVATGSHQEPPQSEIDSVRDSLTAATELKGKLDTYKGVLEGFAPVVAQAQDIINDAISQVKNAYEQPNVDTQGNQTFNSDFSLDLSNYGINTDVDYKKLVDDYYNQTNSVPKADTTNPDGTEKTPDTDKAGDNGDDRRSNPGSPSPGSPSSGGPSGTPSTPSRNTESEPERTTEIQTKPIEVPTMAPTEPRTERHTEPDVEYATDQYDGDFIIEPSRPYENQDIITLPYVNVDGQKPIAKNLSSNMDTFETIMDPEILDKPEIVVIDPVSSDYSENIVIPSVEQPVLEPLTPSPDRRNLKTMGIATGVGLALGATALGVHSALKSKEESEEDYGYNK